MRHLILIAALVFVPLVTPAYGNTGHYEAVVAEPFLELHTGPGRGYPVFHVVDRGEQIDVVKRRTDWFQVRTKNGVEGWVKSDQMAETLDSGGMPTTLGDPTAEDYAARRWEAGLQLGDFDGANLIAVYGGYHFTRNLSVEVQVGEVTGDFSNGWLATADIVHQPFPEWRVSPYAALGTGVIHIEPQATLVQEENRTDQIAHVGLGLRMYVTKRFMFRGEYNSYLTFTNRDDNEEIDAWQAGFAFFF